MLRDARRRLPLLLVLGLIGAGCERPIPEPSAHTATRWVQTTAVSAFRYGERTQAQTPDPAWLAAAREDPDPNVRRHALETWAQNPGESLDPVTYALVDADETVRTRAQDLLEDALARR